MAEWGGLRLYGAVTAGATVTVTTAGDEPLDVALLATSFDLLERPGLGVPPRPFELMTAPSRYGDAVVVQRSWRLD